MPQSGALAEQELVSSLSWLTRLRWFAGVGVLLATGFSAVILDVNIRPLSLYLLGAGLLVYNALLWWGLEQLKRAPLDSDTLYQWFARLQIGLDWVATALLVHLTGGIESPVLLYFLFHIVIAAMLLPHDRAFLYVALAPVLVGGVAFLEYQGILSHVPVFDPARYDDPLYVAGVLFFFTSASYVMAYLSIGLSRRLRRREGELLALYQSVKTTTETLDLDAVLDRLCEATARALRCKGAVIRLLNDADSCLEVRGAHGLSQDYLAQKRSAVACDCLDQETLLGETMIVLDVTQEDRLCDRQQLVAEGIRTIVSTPLPGKRGPIGVLWACGDAAQRFAEDDADFAQAIAAQGAVAIENAQACQMLEDLDRQKSQFVRIVTHELRSPVQVTGSLLKVLGRGYAGELSAEQTDLVDRAQQRIQFLQTLIDDLLDLAAGKAEVMDTGERGVVSLNDVVKTVYSRFEAAAQEKQLVLRLDCPEQTLNVWGEKSELERVVNNLVSNAVKYTFAGEVNVSLERQDGSAQLVVSDTGIGIPQDAMSQLFEEFFRAKNAKDIEASGTGLGLSIVKDLVKRYGGDIDVQSVQGEGTTFTVTLPLVKVKAVP